MILDERISAYLRALDPGGGPLLEEIERKAREDHVPVIRREEQAFLRTMVAMKQPERILEIGTAIGFSALVMASAMPEGGHITTIEKFEKRIPEARENFRRAGEEKRITLLPGDAGEILAGLSGPYDLIFLDAAKGQYIRWLPDILRLLPAGGVLLTDNVLQGGETALSRYAVERRDRTIHTRIREYLWEITHSASLTTAVVPTGDGIAVSVRTAAPAGGGIAAREKKENQEI
jgi:predicted O-methyltransferase YrrM